MAPATLVTSVLLALGPLLGGSGAAQEPPKAAEAAERPQAAKADKPAERVARLTASTVRVQIVISRFQGEQKVASLPYTLIVGSGGPRTRMRMGIDTPVPVGSPAAPTEGAKSATPFQYRNVGTNIDCGVEERNGLHQLSLSIENSAALRGPESTTNMGSDPGVARVPLFRRFETSLEIALRDGQSLQTIASTDPASGEVVKIDVTLNVVK